MSHAPSDPPAPRGPVPLSPIQRRVLGVLVEKAKTTPDQYPLSLNALRNGANQKNNRDPLMELDEDQLERALEELRGLAAVSEVQGGGRVPRFRHHLYQWLGVDKVELAVLAELLLRGPQTEGELRGRASRMEPIADLATLRTLVDGLKAKGLVVGLTPPGRGHLLTHALYPPEELDKIRARVGSGDAQPAEAAEAPVRSSDSPRPAAAASHPAGEVARLVQELGELRDVVAQLRRDLEELSENFQRSLDEMYELRQSMGG